MGKLSGRNALVTGASRGIGRGIAVELAREGADVAIHYRRDEAAARDTARTIAGLHCRAHTVQADVSDWDAVRAMVDDALAHFGHLDIVVANSGIASRVQSVWDLDVEHWHKVVGVNLHGVFYTCKAVAKHMVDRQQGTIILISSIGADTCGPFGAPYYVAKAGVNALTKSLAKECAPAKVRVNCIAPGLISSDMGDRLIKFHGDAIVDSIPLGRPGRPDEVGKMAAFLASDDAAFITGKIFRLDGGAFM